LAQPPDLRLLPCWCVWVLAMVRSQALIACCLVWLLLASVAQGQFYEFCTNGTQKLDLVEDEGQPSVDLILVQAPLFSTNPKIGGKLSIFGLFHTALVFAQGEGDSRKYWTLEFDFTSGSILSGIMPTIEGDALIWNNDARFCLTGGLLWGRSHWTKSFQTVFRLTSAQANSVLRDFVFPINASAHGQRPQYQLWRVGPTDKQGRVTETLVRDTTCSDGVGWLLHHISAKMDIKPVPGFVLQATATVVNAERIELVNTTDPEEWRQVVKFYTHLVELRKNVSAVEKLWDVFRLVRHEYVYDTNFGKYYRIFGNRFPWMHTEYTAYQLVDPPSAAQASKETMRIVI